MTKHFFLFVAIAATSINLQAHDLEVNGLYYNILSNEDKTVEVTYKGKVNDNADYVNESISIPSVVIDKETKYTVVSIGENAFAHCKQLNHVSLPQTITNISPLAFAYCESILSINIPSSLETLGYSVFLGCKSLDAINVDKNNLNFVSEDGVLYSYNRDELICFPAGKQLDSFTIPEQVKTISNVAFAYTRAKNIQLSENISTISYGMFMNSTVLESVILPSGLTKIEAMAFTGTKGMKAIWNQAQEPPYIVGNNEFPEDIYSTCLLYVPTGCETKYKQSVSWSKFQNIQECDFSGINDTEDTNSNIIATNGSISVPNMSTKDSLTIYSINGECIYSGCNNKVTDLTPGLYIIHTPDYNSLIWLRS